MTDEARPSFYDTVRRRRAIRRFLPEPVPQTLLRQIFEEAQMAPSNGNTQPWEVHVVSGAARDRMAAALDKAYVENGQTLDFTFSFDAYKGLCDTRHKARSAAYYDMMGLARSDTQGRWNLVRENLNFFGAPHGVFLFIRDTGDNVRVAADVGMYAQTLMLSCTANGVSSMPQTMLGIFADTVREVLALPNELKLLFGLSLGYPDMSAKQNQFQPPRAPIDECVRFHV